MFKRALPTSVFDGVGVLRELLCVRYGYCSQAMLSGDEMDFIVQLLRLQYVGWRPFKWQTCAAYGCSS